MYSFLKGGGASTVLGIEFSLAALILELELSLVLPEKLVPQKICTVG